MVYFLFRYAFSLSILLSHFLCTQFLLLHDAFLPFAVAVS